MQESNFRRRGFTIVELLIVVVVIAILAAITLVAFNGISQQAKTAQYAAAVDGVEKQVRMSMIEGTLAPDGLRTSCLGEVADFPADDIFEAGECYIAKDTSGQTVMAFSHRPADYADIVESNRQLRVGALPVASMNSGGYKFYGRGIIAMVQVNPDPNIDIRVMLQWLVPDKSSCGRGGGTYGSLLKVINDALNGVITLEEAEQVLGADPGTLTLEDLRNARDIYTIGGDLCVLTIE